MDTRVRSLAGGHLRQPEEGAELPRAETPGWLC